MFAIKLKNLLPLGMLLALAANACSNSRDVEVSGEVQGQAGQPILLEFFDVQDGEKLSITTVTLEAPGVFNETVPLEGDQIIVRAIADADGDQACSAGEAWGEASGSVSDDDQVEQLTLSLVVQACPDVSVAQASD